MITRTRFHNGSLRAKYRAKSFPNREAGFTRAKGFAQSEAGFTLIEILLVVTLLGLMASLVLPNMGGVFQAGAKSSVRRYAALVKQAYDQAVVTGTLHRVVLNLTEQSWRLEKAKPGQLPIDPTKFGLMPEGFRDDDRVVPEAAFETVGKRLVEKLPSGAKLLEFASWRIGEGKVVKEGEVSIYAYPTGLIDEATVVIAEAGTEDLQRFLVSTKPLSGRVTIVTENTER